MERVHTLPCRARRSAVPTRANAKIHVDIVLFNGFTLPDVAALIEIFHKANACVASRGSARAPYDISLLSADGGRIASSSSVFVWTENVDSHRGSNDTHLLFIAGGVDVQSACGDERLRVWLRHRHPLSAVVHPIAEGSLLLKAAGLRGRYCQSLYEGAETRERHTVASRSETATAVRTALRIIEEDLGAESARQVAKSIAPLHTTPFSSSIARSAAPQVSETIMTSARWLEANIARPISIDDAARLASMSERNFLRRFKSEIGMTPSDYLLHARLNLSCQMLVESRLPIDKIARRCGIGSGGQLAKLFRKYLATTPTEYRLNNEAPVASLA